ncbi:hypothetical protein HAX54_025193, partial [Datura stramonium]|nr:hypothetical protein [Datura stramonium]
VINMENLKLEPKSATSVLVQKVSRPALGGMTDTWCPIRTWAARLLSLNTSGAWLALTQIHGINGLYNGCKYSLRPTG